MSWTARILTLFPEMFQAARLGVTDRGVRQREVDRHVGPFQGASDLVRDHDGEWRRARERARILADRRIGGRRERATEAQAVGIGGNQRDDAASHPAGGAEHRDVQGAAAGAHARLTRPGS